MDDRKTFWVFVTLAGLASSELIWECDQWPVDAPLDGCNWNRSEIYLPPADENPEGNVASVQDPDPSREGNALSVFYANGSYAGNKDDYGGITFYATGFGAHHDLILEYDVYHSENFDFVLAGKHPGLYSGVREGCSNGTRDVDCFSARFMWRQNGAGEVYLYLPYENATWFCNMPDVFCDPKWGTSFGRGSFTFRKGQWQTIGQRIRLNTPGVADGMLIILYEGQPVWEITGLTYRIDYNLMIDELYFSTFFGGSSRPDFASTVDCYSYYRNIRISTP